MRFARHPRRTPPETAVPMINVVFLLLIFFLMSARLAPPHVVDVDLPQAGSDNVAEEAVVLYLDTDGPVMDGFRGDAVWQALAGLTPRPNLTLRADAALPGADVAKVLTRLAALGMTEVELAVRPK